MALYLFAIQDKNGREVISWKGEVDKVSEVTAVHVSEGGLTEIVFAGKVVASGETAGPADELQFLRWPADDKLAEPVRHPVITK